MGAGGEPVKEKKHEEEPVKERQIRGNARKKREKEAVYILSLHQFNFFKKIR